MSTSVGSIKVTCQGAATLSIDQLVEFQGNLKKLSKKNLEKLKARILEDGFNVPFFVWDHEGTFSLLDGHQRMRALSSLKMDGYEIPALPVAYIEAADIADARKKLLAISSQYGEFDAEELSEWMKSLDDGIADTLRIVDGELVLNIDQEEKEAAIKDADPRMQEAERLRVKWGTEKGQLWKLGGHRIMCGDSTIPAQVDFLMGEDLADMAFTDPPYGVSYVGVNNPNGSAWTMIENDDLRGDSLVQFLVAAFTNMYNTLKINTAIYVWYASSTHIQFETALNAAGFEVKQQLIWNKGMVLGHSDYHWAHEPLLYCKKKDQKTTWYGDRTNKTILRAKRTDLAKLKKDELMQIVKNLMDENTNWEIDRDSIKTYMHPTQKPTALAYRAIVNSSDDGAIVQDLFSGSGTTLVACENCNRKARVMEFDPGYVAVAIERWHEVTGEMPEIIGVIDEEQII